MTRRLSEAAQSLVVHYEALAKSGQMSTEAAQQAALTAISALRFGKEDYFFVLSADGKLIANAFNAKNVGKQVLDQTDVPGGKRYFAEMVETALRDGSGIVNYMKPRPGGTEPVEKIASVQLFKPWGWIIATGLYRDDVYAAVRARGTTIALWSAGLALPVVALLLLIGPQPVAPDHPAHRRDARPRGGRPRGPGRGPGPRRRGRRDGRAVQVFKDALIAKRAADAAAVAESDAKMRRRRCWTR